MPRNKESLAGPLPRRNELLPEQSHELTLQPFCLLRTQTLLVAHKVEAHFAVQRISDQSQQPDIERMHVQAQVLHPKRGVAVADHNIAKIGERETVPTAIHLQCVSQPHHRLHLRVRQRSKHLGEVVTPGNIEHLPLDISADLFIKFASPRPEVQVRGLSRGYYETPAAEEQHVALQRSKTPPSCVHRAFDQC